MNRQQVLVLGTKLDVGFSVETAADFIIERVKSRVGNEYICTTNPEFIIDGQSDDEFRDIINRSFLSLPDGIGTLYAVDFYNMLGKKSKNPLVRITRSLSCALSLFAGGGKYSKGTSFQVSGVELFLELAKRCAKEGLTIALIGGRRRDKRGIADTEGTDVSRETADKLREMFPQIKVVYASSEFTHRPPDDQRTLDSIHQEMSVKGIKSIDLTFVAYNHLNQEKWIYRNKDKIASTMSIGVGGTFDYVIGIQKMPPTVIKKLHLSWLYRLTMEPWRFSRVAKAFPVFPIKVFLDSVKQ